jgi:hypothetical protein
MNEKHTNDVKRPDMTTVDPGPLRIHRKVLTFVYALSLVPAWLVVSAPEPSDSVIGLLASGAILATFGSALCALAGAWERDLLDRVKSNVEIFFEDIYKQDRWRRWSFLPRKEKRKALDGNPHHLTLKNPEIPVDLGSHVIRVDLPTVLDDFFDLPVVRNLWKLHKFRHQARIAWTRRDKKMINPNTGLDPGDERMAFECLYDIWISVAQFRLARYILHLGSGLVFFSCLFVFVYAVRA